MNAIRVRDGTMVAACLLLTPLATASEYEMDFLGTFGRQVEYSLNGGEVTGDVKAGLFNWTVVSSNADGHPNFSPGAHVQTFCMELTQFVGPDYDGADLQDFNSADPGAPSISDTRAALVSELFGKYYGATQNESVPLNSRMDRAAGFQLALWEILHEGTNADDLALIPGGMLDISSGSFTAWQLDSDRAVSIANRWLGELTGNGNMSPNLYAWVDPDNQDQVVFIPLPAPAMIAGVGLLGVVLARRRAQRLI